MGPVPGVSSGPIGTLSPGPWTKPALIRRLRRIEGQARGLQKMVEEERDADEVLMQIASMREALLGAASLVLESFLSTSAEATLQSDDMEETQRLLGRAVEVFRKWVR